MPQTDKVRRQFMISVYQDGETPPSIRVEFVPRGLQAVREPGGLPKRVPTFLARARLEGETIVAVEIFRGSRAQPEPSPRLRRGRQRNHWTAAWPPSSPRSSKLIAPDFDRFARTP